MLQAESPCQELLLIAGEVSGDQHGAALVHALHEHSPSLRIYGVGGAAMRAAGVETLYDIAALNVVGAVEALACIPAAWRMACGLLQAIRRRHTRVAVLIDAPGFNLFFARWARQAGVRVLYYVSPQIWAWRQHRVHKMARHVDKVLTLFPFEVPLYTAAGVEAEYVGHPVLDQVATLPTAAQAATALGLDARRPVVALLPGSRVHEVQRLLPPMLAALQHIQQRLPQAQGVLPVAATISRTLVEACRHSCPIPLTVLPGQSQLALRAAHFAFVASGTATLEAGLIGTPLVVVYQVHWLTAWLARRVLQIPWIGLVNIVAGEKLAPELLQHEVRPAAMAALALQCLENPQEEQRLRHSLCRLTTILGEAGGARRAAAAVWDFCQQTYHKASQA